MRRDRSRRRSGDAGPLALLALVLVAGAIVAFRVSAAVATGPGWDTYAFLANAAEFAGKGYGYTELHRPPFMSALTALAFRAGAPMHESVIQWVDGVLSLSGIVAFYLVLRRIFDQGLAAVGALMLLCLQPLWSYLGSGYTDFPSVALSLWLLWACVMAVESDARWYLLAGPLFVAAVLTRYTALLAAFPVSVYLSMRWRPFKQAKHLAGAAALGLASYLPAGRFYLARFGDVLFPFIIAFGVSEATSSPVGSEPAGSSALWYLTRLPASIAGERLALIGGAVLLVAALGIVLKTGTHIQERRMGPRRLALVLAGCAPALLAQMSGSMVLRQIAIPVSVALVWRALAGREHDDPLQRVPASSALAAALVTWLLTYLDFHGHQTVQVPRYLVPMAPGLIFLILYGWQSFFSDIHRTLAATAESSQGRPEPVILRLGAPTMLGCFVAAALAVSAGATAWTPERLNVATERSARWLAEQPGIAGSVVFSDVWPMTAWYGRLAAKPMPFFKTAEQMQHALDKAAVDYYVTIRGRTFDGYEKAAAFGTATVLRRTVPAPDDLPRVLYLGKAWENYLESVTSFTFYLDGDPGRYGWEGTAFLDALEPEALERWSAVAVYDVRWRNRARGEAALLEYVRDGGSVVIDASANLGELPYDLADTVMFDTVIRRASVPQDADITVGSALVERHPRLARMRAAPFVDEGGGSWYGADYAPLPGSPDLEVLASVNGRPAVALRRIGRGRVYFIGYNLVWHAFLTENEDEQELIRAVFEEALEAGRAP